jgi:hypothetical protein
MMVLRNRWTESIAQKVKRKKQPPEHTRKQIWRSVFEPTIPPVPTHGFVRRNLFCTAMAVDIPRIQSKTLNHNAPMTDDDFDAYGSHYLLR